MDAGNPVLTQDVLNAAQTLWRFHNRGTPLRRRADCIVGLCSYDLRVADRCVQLFRAGHAPHILFTGAVGNWTHGLYARSEARAFHDHASQAGVPEDCMSLEEQARNIGENLQYAAAMLGPAPTVILVTKPQTQMRCRASAAVQWPAAQVCVTAPQHDLSIQVQAPGGWQRLLEEMVGDLTRMDRYPALGFQRPVRILQTVRHAYDILVRAGFTGHLPKFA